MSLVRWDPFNQFFHETPARRAAEDGLFFSDWAPAVDVQETDNEYIVKADLPDVKKEDVKVEVEDGVLTVSGERKQEKEEKGKKFHRVERAYGTFVRRFGLPTAIDAASVKAEFKDGVLNVRLPKAAEAKPRTVEIKVA